MNPKSYLADAIHLLEEEQARISEALAVLRSIPSASSYPKDLKKRGRKSMGEKERREVSARMKRYWANRRKAGAAA
jgi:hypothetical protein